MGVSGGRLARTPGSARCPASCATERPARSKRHKTAAGRGPRGLPGCDTHQATFRPKEGDAQEAGGSMSPLDSIFTGLVCFLKKSSFAVCYSIRRPARHVDVF